MPNAIPSRRIQMFLLREGILDDKGITQLEKEVEADLQSAVDRALEALPPAPESVMTFLYSPDLDVTSSIFETQPAAQEPSSDAKKPAAKTMADLITGTLRDEMKRDERIVIFGEDVADCSREEYLKQKLVKGKGGVFKLTFGLQCEFGNDRVFNSPLAEAAIVGRATGMATRGLKPVIEIQFFDYIWPAMHADSRRVECNPLALEQWNFLPSGRSRCDRRIPDRRRDLSFAVRRKHLYPYAWTSSRASRRIRWMLADCCAPPSVATIRFCSLSTSVCIVSRTDVRRIPDRISWFRSASAKIVQPGTDLTVITYGAVVPRALQAAQKLEREQGVKVELIDLRTLDPFDWETIAESVAKTNRALVAYEDTLSWGYGAEIAARIADKLFDELDAPVRRVAAIDTFVAYQPILEDAILPQPNDLYLAMKELAEY